MTPLQIWKKLENPSDIYSLWSTEQRRAFFYEKLGRYCKGQLEYNLLVIESNESGEYLKWLNKKWAN